ncbi:hypothetical protein K502DRAFT_337399 [Neoconidiobolus thromboides FSU 785]|nr:hypothetical protein K502DRAFT_337399 [Neoconidiobolus thromboides FSU 785]
MHFLMLIILLFFVIFIQWLVLYWKKKAYKSYQLVSLVGLWLIPILFFYFITPVPTFTYFWCFFSILNSWIIYQASKTPLNHLTPRLVYKWFEVTHNISYVVGMVGYIGLMITLFMIPPPEQPNETSEFMISLPFKLLCYGLYFGILSRDFAELCSDRMASALGYYVKDGIPSKQIETNKCGICGWYLREIGKENELYNNDNTNDNKIVLQDNIYKLECDHEFHEKCIRGWCIIGKKEICPYCLEKVDLSKFKNNPWDTQQMYFLNLLDYVRYLIVWQPLILLLVQGSYWLLKLK